MQLAIISIKRNPTYRVVGRLIVSRNLKGCKQQERQKYQLIGVCSLILNGLKIEHKEFEVQVSGLLLGII